MGSSVNPISGRVLPLMSKLAYLAMGCPTALATNGTVLEALGLASMMYTCSTAWVVSDMSLDPMAGKLVALQDSIVAQHAFCQHLWSTPKSHSPSCNAGVQESEPFCAPIDRHALEAARVRLHFVGAGQG